MNASKNGNWPKGVEWATGERPPLCGDAAFLGSILGQLSHGVVLTDRSATIRYVNPAFERMTGYAAAEVLGRTPRLLKSGRHPRKFYSEFWATISQGKPWHGHVTDKTKDGRLFHCELAVTPLLSATGDVAGYAGLQRPCGESEIGIATPSEDMMARSLNRVMSHVMHDISNAMTVILGFSSILKDGIATDGQTAQSGIAQILRAAEQAADLTRELIAFTRNRVLNLQRIDLNSALASLRNLLAHMLGHNGRLDLQLADESLCVAADSALLRHLMVNLVADAREAMPEGGNLTIRTSALDAMPPASPLNGDAPKGPCCLLQLRGSPSTASATRYADCGAGYALCAGIVRQFGGAIRRNLNEECVPDVEIWLPRVAEPDEEEVRVVAEEPRPQRGTETILYVEDDEFVRGSTAAILRVLGYRVIESPSGGRALELLHRYGGALDLIIADVVMPGISGPEFVGSVPERFRKTPVIYTSSYTDDFALSRDDMSSVAAFLEKPFRYEALAGTVRDVLDKHRAASQAG